MADIHLGYQQYGLSERFDDFSKVFINLVEEALKRQVDFVLLAGDLFHKRTVNPLAMRVAVAGLGTLRDAGVPVLAVEGNHEKAYYRDQYSWLEFLDAMGYLRLLNPSFEEGQAVLTPHGEGGGAYADLAGGIRVYGLKYYGASTSRALTSFTDALSSVGASGVRYTILMMHAGLEGQLAHMGSLRMGDLAPLRDTIDYVALGHIHKPYEVNDWIFNPGSPEACSIQEADSWPSRGANVVEIDLDADPPHRIDRFVPERRAFHRLSVEVDGLTSPQAVYDAVDALIARKDAEVRTERAPVVEVLLTGILPFNRYELDLNTIQLKVERAWNPLTVRVQSHITPAEFEINVEAEASRAELEHSVIQQLIERDQRYRAEAETWTTGARRLKELVLAGSAPEAVVAHLRDLRDEVGELDNPTAVAVREDA
jgi:DNA repair exonuclease SbcCD nuclease subunit